MSLTDTTPRQPEGLSPRRVRLIVFAAMAVVAVVSIFFIDRRAMQPRPSDTIQHETPDEQLRLD